MKFKSYLNESVRTSQIDLEETIDLLFTKCKKNIKDFVKTKKYIYRGFDTKAEPFLLGDSNKGEARTSANTANYYTLLMDNSKYWKDYPKRSRSFICGRNYIYAEGYGDLYYVIPYDGTKIGVCSESDIWSSFKYALNKNDTLDDFNFELESIFKLSDSYTSWDKLKNDIRKIKSVEKFLVERCKDLRVFKDFFDTLEEQYIIEDEDFIQWWEDYFKPEKNGFVLTTDIKKVTDNSEVWIQGNVVFIHKNRWDAIAGMVKNEI